METYKATGKVVEVGETKTRGSNGFTVREIIIDTSKGNYPSPVKFTLKKDRTAQADGLSVGDDVEVEFTIDGRSWTPQDGTGTRYFTDLTAWKMQKQGGGQSAKPQNQYRPAVAVETDPDDLPF